jgi:hypothetical protein
VNGALRSDVENKRVTYSRIHSASGSNTFDTMVGVNGALRSDIESIIYSRMCSTCRLSLIDSTVLC